MSKRDYYEVLGVSKSATDVAIKKAYRKQAMKYHPDRAKDDADSKIKFQEIQEAYSVLSNEKKRAIYDQFGHAGLQEGAAGASGGGGFEFSDLGDVFGDLFGNIFGEGSSGRQSGRSARRGADLGYEIELTLEEVFHGVERTIQVPTWVSCKTCKGKGSADSDNYQSCIQCAGAGQVRMRHGFLEVQQTCPKCHGEGRIIKNPCKSCSGNGRVRQTKKLSVKIPAGVDTGDRIRVAGEGEAGYRGAPPGDLYVEVHVQRHSVFQRQDNDLHTHVPIDFVTAALGGEIAIPTLSETVNLKIPAETQSGQQFRLRKKGLKGVRSSAYGDLICHVAIETPVNLTEEQKSHLKQWDALLKDDSKNHSPRTRTWLDAMKDFFSSKKTL